MAIDYAKALATATRLISENGRAITVGRRSEAPADPARPWGPRTTSAGTVSVSTIGVFLDLDRDDLTTVTAGLGLGGSNVQAKGQRVLVPAAPALPSEVGPDWFVEDVSTGELHEITASHPLKPGGTLVMYSLELAL